MVKKARTLAREAALNVLYQVDGCGVPFDEALATAISNADFDKTTNPAAAKEYTRFLTEGIREHKEIDKVIMDFASDEWPFYRLPVVDKNILRIAVFEIDFSEDVDDAVAVDESLKLADTFAGAGSARFINGLLASYLKSKSNNDEKES
ncbi:MAG: transcription antitermination factor NusB [Abditibacteriota bacterium]|nr:transcription antitermination factor NusB [Abditibacteriota bacterium]